MPFAPVDGGQLFYRLEGRADLPVLVFSNSLGTNHTMWAPQIAPFSQHFRVLRYDSRGHGASSVPDGEYSLDQLGGDVLALLDHLEIAAASFCGLSVGGLTGQWLALHAPERFKKVVLCNTAARIGTEDAWNERIALVRAGGVRAISQAILARWFTQGFHEQESDTVDRFRTILESTAPEGYAGTSAAIRDCDLRDRISRVSLPVMVIAGLQDTATPPEGARFLAQQIKGAVLVELDAAHLSNVELPQRFTEEVLRFLVS